MNIFLIFPVLHVMVYHIAKVNFGIMLNNRAFAILSSNLLRTMLVPCSYHVRYLFDRCSNVVRMLFDHVRTKVVVYFDIISFDTKKIVPLQIS